MNTICQRYRCLQLIINVGVTTVISVTIQMLEDAKEVIRSQKSNAVSLKKKERKTKNYPQNTKQSTKD